jgi:hypothetical protein
MRRRKLYLEEVDSEAVYAMGYDEAPRELYVLFRNERPRPYVYDGVTPSEWHMLQHTSSVGAVVNRHIKARHDYRQLDPGEVEIVIRPRTPATHD